MTVEVVGKGEPQRLADEAFKLGFLAGLKILEERLKVHTDTDATAIRAAVAEAKSIGEAL